MISGGFDGMDRSTISGGGGGGGTGSLCLLFIMGQSSLNSGDMEPAGRGRLTALSWSWYGALWL